MPHLNIFTSNRLEILAEQLARVVREPLLFPVSPEIIVVQSKGMERWLSMELARRNGICANCRFPFPNTFLQEITKKIVSDLPERSPFEPDIMTFGIMKTLPYCLELPGFKHLKKYLDDDSNDMKLFQISQRIADLFDQYLVFRPEMIFDWDKGKGNHWQAHLWRKLSSGKERFHRARLRRTLIEKIKQMPSGTAEFPQRLSIFGISYLPPFYMETFVAIAKIIQVNIFLMNPCKEYWADIVSEQEIYKIREKHARYESAKEDLYLEEGNRLLASMGRSGRNFFSMISGLDCPVYEFFEDDPKKTILSKIQSDILNLKDRKGHPDTDTEPCSSIQFHSCHSPMREIEVLHDNLLAMFEEDPDILPKDILVMTPDIESYAPFIQAVFDTRMDGKVRIPFTIVDQSARRESRLIDVFMSILDLKNSRLGVTTVLALLESQEIKEQFKLTPSDVETAERWIRETNIRWGIDADFRRKFGLPGFSENTWEAGIKRLLLGYAMPGFDRQMFAGIVPFDHIEGNAVTILGKLLEFLDRVFSCVTTLNKPRTLSDWHMRLVAILEQFFVPSEDSERERHVLRRIMARLSEAEELSGFDKLVEIEVVRSYLDYLLAHEHLGTGFISSGVTFCSMLPMRSIPFKIICLVGMNSDAFPRESKTLSFDLISQKPKPGDRSRRNDDKYLFLEAFISARHKFYASYVGQSIQDNLRIPPSVLLSELLDTIQEGFNLAEEDIVNYHKLQAFSSDYFKADSRFFSYSKENFEAICTDTDRGEPTAFVSHRLSEPSRKWKYLDMAHLCAFFRNPARFLLEKRLGVYLTETTAISDDRENFFLDHLEKYLLSQDLVKSRLTGSDLIDLLPLKKATGQLPHGKVGDLVFSQLSVEAEVFAGKINHYVKDKQLESLGIDFDISDFSLFGHLPGYVGRELIQIHYADTKPKYLLNTWICHLILSAVIEEKNPSASYMICKDAVWEFAVVEKPKDLLTGLLELYWDGMSEPLPFFPESSFEYVRQIQLKNQTKKAGLNFAQTKWIGSDFVRGESEDPYFELCFGKTNPLNEIFLTTANKIFSPLLLHRKEIIL
jgi:exodeoxyribonuclease V gamma subunit